MITITNQILWYRADNFISNLFLFLCLSHFILIVEALTAPYGACFIINFELIICCCLFLQFYKLTLQLDEHLMALNFMLSLGKIL
jgi:hypothetical protein